MSEAKREDINMYPVGFRITSYDLDRLCPKTYWALIKPHHQPLAQFPTLWLLAGF